MDRAPEVKTIRRKLAELAARGKAADLSWQSPATTPAAQERQRQRPARNARREVRLGRLAGDDGQPRKHDLADTDIKLTVRTGTHQGRVLDLRQVTRRKPAQGGAARQAHILTPANGTTCPPVRAPGG